jgi:hypothetical protein
VIVFLPRPTVGKTNCCPGCSDMAWASGERRPARDVRPSIGLGSPRGGLPGGAAVAALAAHAQRAAEGSARCASPERRQPPRRGMDVSAGGKDESNTPP